MINISGVGLHKSNSYVTASSTDSHLRVSLRLQLVLDLSTSLPICAFYYLKYENDI